MCVCVRHLCPLCAWSSDEQSAEPRRPQIVRLQAWHARTAPWLPAAQAGCCFALVQSSAWPFLSSLSYALSAGMNSPLAFSPLSPLFCHLVSLQSPLRFLPCVARPELPSRPAPSLPPSVRASASLGPAGSSPHSSAWSWGSTTFLLKFGNMPFRPACFLRPSRAADPD